MIVQEGRVLATAGSSESSPYAESTHRTSPVRTPGQTSARLDGHPDPAIPDGDRLRAPADLDRLHDLAAYGIDPGHGAVAAVCDPDAAEADRDVGG